ncbi:MAG: fatty acid desaturase [Nostocaceae cyanobacterium]|nr:fatty acid desaturase [Nostocaceae cyanobacterium]
MKIDDKQMLIPQPEYAKTLRPLLPEAAFLPDPSKLIIILINLAILILGWAIADHLDLWQPYLLWLYLPLAIVMGNSITVLLFGTHELMHGSVTRAPYTYILKLLGLTMLWMPPTFWKAVHNREHHNKTNSLNDPDRNYLSAQPETWGKWIQNLFVPSAEVNFLGLTIGMATAWGVHNFRNLTSVLLLNRKSANYITANFAISARSWWAIAGELVMMAIIHLSILAYLQFNLVKMVLAYFLPIAIGYAGAMFYIYTNHLLCRMTTVNDSLINSLSLRMPKIFNLLHLNFAYHTEHHIFPGINSDYYPMVQELIKIHYPERYNLLDFSEAWRLLMQTPRHYKNETTLTDWSGQKSVPCPLKNCLGDN